MARLHRQLSWNSPLFYAALVGVAGLYGLALAQLSLLNACLLVFFSLVGLGTLREPLVGLLATLFLGLLWAWLRAELPAVPALIAMPVLALTLAAWLLRGAVRREIRLRTPFLLLPLILFIGTAALSLWDGVELQVYGLPEGSFHHGELALDQLYFMRPVSGWARHQTPIKNLYLCGSGTHPGGGVSGACGLLASRRILED